ncbi:hypothetical protein E1301_Tti015520 [Triplophysa tibetana]|uniref:DUF7869 domain-containing protein n=1 Tax=Triplophysa tibetana TaxID=1572043 RepID=A0A5A9N0S7_9TELE|nr:hypothetical protein E1301_Tti015520 [Triplophysa tibetana]
MEVYDEMDKYVTVSVTGKRKRRQQHNSARSKAKENRYSASDRIPRVRCTHSNGVLCRADTLTETDITYINKQLYFSHDKVKQDAILLSHMDVMPCKRRRVKVKAEDKQRQRDLTVKYFVLKEDQTNVPVCQASFLSIFGVKRDRVHGVAKYWLKNGKARPENRGGSRQKQEEAAKRETIHNHIQSFTCRASRYAGRGAPGRQYLPSDLSVAQMHRMFLEQNHQQVSYSLYWSIFVYDFNLAFGHPAKDVCSSCVKYRNAIKEPDPSAEEKQKTILLYTLHRRRARQFYKILNEVGDTLTICFDMMENLVLPKSAVGQAHFSRQLNMYVFGVVRHHGRGEPQRCHDIHLYTWLEYQNSKDSNTVASALWHYLSSVARAELCQCESLRLFSDSCYGRNKNMHLLSMLFALRSHLYPQLNVTYFLPIRGHSFLPAHRVFESIEQDIRKKTTILMPEEYCEILRKHGTVHEYGKDWQCYNFRDQAARFTNSQRTFEISDARVLQVSGDTLGFKPAFTGEFSQHSVLKQGKKWCQFNPPLLPDVNCVKAMKRSDVMKLLGEIGVQKWVQGFYKRILLNAGVRDVAQDLEDCDED